MISETMGPQVRAVAGVVVVVVVGVVVVVVVGGAGFGDDATMRIANGGAAARARCRQARA
jgi:hypothetical protein